MYTNVTISTYLTNNFTQRTSWRFPPPPPPPLILFCCNYFCFKLPHRLSHSHAWKALVIDWFRAYCRCSKCDTVNILSAADKKRPTNLINVAPQNLSLWSWNTVCIISAMRNLHIVPASDGIVQQHNWLTTIRDFLVYSQSYNDQCHVSHYVTCWEEMHPKVLLSLQPTRSISCPPLI